MWFPSNSAELRIADSSSEKLELLVKYSVRCFAISLLACAVFGCGDDRPAMVSVTGKVEMYSLPVTAGAIYFHPDAANSFQDDSPSSQLQTDGRFTMKTFPYGDGVPPGKYKVTLTPELATRIEHPDFGRLDKTPWEIEVPATGLKDHVFDVK